MSQAGNGGAAAYDARMRAAARPFVLVAVVTMLCASAVLNAQPAAGLSPAEKQRRLDIEKELQSIAVVDRKVMLPMPDGVRLATDVYRPKNAAGKVPVIFSRTPYNFNFWDVKNGVLTNAKTGAHHHGHLESVIYIVRGRARMRWG